MKVLIIDDSPKLLELLSNFLEREGYECICAAGGQEGLDKHKLFKPDIVCLDLLMTDMTGFEVCRELRERDPDLTVVIISSQSNAEVREKCKKAGAVDFIAKPFQLSDVRERVRLITRKSILEHDLDQMLDSFSVGDLEVFPRYMHAERSGKVIDLNLRDLDLLRFMYDHRGEVVKQAYLRPFCRLYGAHKDDTVVGWSMQQLINKIEKDPAAPSIIKQLEDGAYILEG